MIGHLKGILLEKQPPQLLLEVNGVGYEVDAPLSTFSHLPQVGQEIQLCTHLVVREDAHHLYGFYSREERSLFRILLKVNGIGPRLALTILSSIDRNEFVHSILHHDTSSLVKISGIGKKTAERLVIEIRDKLTEFSSSLSIPSSPANKEVGNTRRHIIQDAVSALIALGYKPQEASRAISTVDDGLLTSEEMIRRALREKIT